MTRRIILWVLGALVGVFVLTACGSGSNLPVNVNINETGVNVSADPSMITSEVLHNGLVAQGFKANGDKTEYTKGDVVIQVAGGKPTGVKYKGQALDGCKPTGQSVLFGAATGLLDGTQEDILHRFCGN
ncbi:MAG TPA: hypothetical protein VFH06_05100 [Candidatus Saccharimonadales bacterium]|nr:hypothetical protein [Candidatus Saccharimonadales bacterium]